MPNSIAKEKIGAINKTVTKLFQGARWQYIILLEAMIKQYQGKLWQIVNKWIPQIHSAKPDQRKIEIHFMVAEMNTLGQRYIQAAASIGFERALRDLVQNHWLRSYKMPVTAPIGTYSDEVESNAKYLFTSLYPDMVKAVESGDVEALRSFQARVQMYGDVLWSVGQSAYKLAIRDFERFRNSHPVKQ